MPLEADLLEAGGSAALLSMAREVTADVLATMFFSEAVPAPCEHLGPEAPGAVEEWVSARVRFEGSPSGELTVILTCELARSMAAGFLGSDPEEVQGDADGQVSCELANMICGAVLSRLHPDCRVALGMPELIAANFADGGGVHQCFETPDGTLSISMRVVHGGQPEGPPA